MIELYLDTAVAEYVRRFNKCLPIRGVTTNPSILASAGKGLNQVLEEVSSVVDGSLRFHAQVLSTDVHDMVDEAEKIHELPYDIVVKVPATEAGMSAIKIMKKRGIKVLATAIYTAQQGFFAALSGADYLAPYVNRIAATGVDGVQVVADLQQLLEKNNLPSKVMAASFVGATLDQVVAVMKLGIGAITLPVEVVERMFVHPNLEPAIEQFSMDWRAAFGSVLSFES